MVKDTLLPLIEFDSDKDKSIGRYYPLWEVFMVQIAEHQS